MSVSYEESEPPEQPPVAVIAEKDKEDHPVVVSVIPIGSSRSSLSAPPSSSEDEEEDLAQMPPAILTLTRTDTYTADDEIEYPDGGLTAWLQVLAGHLANAIACGYPATFGIFQLYYTATLGLPAAQVSWIGSVQVFLTNATCVVGGRLSDAGYGRHSVLVGSIFMVFGTFMTSLATEYWQIFLAQGLCSGLGLGFIYMPAMAVVGSYFKKRRSLALNIASSGTGTGSLIFPATVQYLIPKVGFAWAVRASGFVALVLVVAMNLLLRPRLAPRKSGPLLELKAFKEVPFALFTLGTFLMYFALYVGTFYLNTYALTLPGGAFTRTSTVNLTLVTSGISTPARLLIGALADLPAFSPMGVYVLSVGSLATTFLAWPAVRAGLVPMYLWAAAFGVANGAAQAGFIAGVAAPALAPDPRSLGARMGVACGVIALATLAGPPVAGAILDRTPGAGTPAQYLGVQLWSGGVEVLALGVLGFLAWYLYKRGNAAKQAVAEKTAA